MSQGPLFYIARYSLLVIMAYIAVAFPVRYPHDCLAFTYLTFLISFLIELAFPKTVDPTRPYAKIVFQCSWTANVAVTFTTFFMLFNPNSIKALNLPSTLALVEMIAMHYTPVLIHIMHLRLYPLYDTTYFCWTPLFPFVYYPAKSALYFTKHEVSLEAVVKQNAIIVVGVPLQYLAQCIGVRLHLLFHGPGLKKTEHKLS